MRTNGTLWAWGNNFYGQLGDGTTTGRTTPVQVGTETNWKAVDTGTSHTVATRTNGTLWAWGGNADGQLGDGTTTARLSPIQIGTNTDWVVLSAGGQHTIAGRAIN